MILDIFYLIYFIFYSPILICRGRWHAGFVHRFGFLPRALKNELAAKKNIWVHAVSVGEVALLEGVIDGLKNAYPEYRIVLSVTTKTGHEYAHKKYAGRVLLCWAPLDLSMVTRGFVKAIAPKMYVAAETELWPNLFKALDKAGVAIILVNARISDKAYPRYSFARGILHKTMSRINLVCAQTDTDAERFKSLGVSVEKVVVAGNVKFDINVPEIKDIGFIKKEAGFPLDDRVLVAASTHRGEEEVLLKAWMNIRRNMPSLRLVLVPRHPERARELSGLVRSNGMCPVFLTQQGSSALQKDDVLVVDAIGYLLKFYALADLVFIGKSLGIPRRGGQNPLEAAAMGKVVIAGPLMENFKDVVRLLKEANGLVEVKSPNELEGVMKSLLEDPMKMSEIGQRAKEVVLQNKGASVRMIEMIRNVV